MSDPRPGSARPTSAGSLYGREREAEALRAAAQRAALGEPQRVLLSGESGSGKTQLLRTMLADSGLPTAWGDTSDFGNGEFGPIKDLLRGLVRKHPRQAALLRTAHPLLMQLLPGSLAEVGPTPSRDELFDGLARGLLSLGEARQFAIVFDDLHAADHATIELLARVGDRLDRQPLLLLLVFRSDDLPRAHPLRRLRQQWRRAGGVLEIELGPLAPAAVLDIATSRLGGAPGPTLTSDLQRLCGGLPLYVEELTQALREQGALRVTGAGFERAPDSPWTLPESLRDSVRLRLAALPLSAQRLAERAAVMGPRLNLLALEAMAADAADVERLAEAGWIVDTEPGHAVFRHALLREVIYGQIPWTRRRHWHGECAARLEAVGAPVELRAEHWLAAHEFGRGRAALLQVVDRAWRTHAYADAAAQAVRALELWPDDAEEEERLRVLDRVGECAQFAGQHDGAARAWLELCERAQRKGLTKWIAPARRRLALLYAMTGDFEGSMSERTHAADALLAEERPLDAARELYAAAFTASGRNQLRRVLALLDRIEGLQQTREQVELQVLVQSLRGRTLARTGRITEGTVLARTALETAQRRGFAAVVGVAYQRLADCHEQAGDYVQSRNIFMAGVDWCAANGQRDGLESCKACALPVLVQCGEWDLALQLSREIVADPGSVPWTYVYAGGEIGRLLALRGQHEAAQPLLSVAVHQCAVLGMATIEWVLRAVFAVNEWWRGHQRAARDEAYAVLRAAALGEEYHHVVPTAATLGDLFCWAADTDGLHACLLAVTRAAAANAQAEALAGVALAQGDVHRAEGRVADALREWQLAAHWLSGLPLPLARARVQRRLADAHGLQGDAAAMARCLREAVDGFKALGAVPHLREATERLRSLSPAELNSDDRRRLHAGLTPRQLQVLDRVAHGKTDKQIARELAISSRTVEMHVGRVLAALQCHSRAEAVLRGSEMGLIGAAGAPLPGLGQSI